MLIPVQRLHSTTFIAPVLAIVLLLSSCGPSREAEKNHEESKAPLPDLTIRKVAYQWLGSSLRLGNTSRTSILMNVEFRVEVANVGGAAFESPFYLSISTSYSDYQNFVYSRHELLNEARTVILPGQHFPFIFRTDVDIPLQPVLMNFPIRFYINTESMSQFPGFSAPRIQEIDYRNNVFEMSLRTRSR